MLQDVRFKNYISNSSNTDSYASEPNTLSNSNSQNSTDDEEEENNVRNSDEMHYSTEEMNFDDENNDFNKNKVNIKKPITKRNKGRKGSNRLTVAPKKKTVITTTTTTTSTKNNKNSNGLISKKSRSNSSSFSLNNSNDDIAADEEERSTKDALFRMEKMSITESDEKSSNEQQSDLTSYLENQMKSRKKKKSSKVSLKDTRIDDYDSFLQKTTNLTSLPETKYREEEEEENNENIVTLVTEIPSFINKKNKKKEIIFNDDELFDLGDNLTRRRIYKSLNASGKITNKKIRKIVCFNFTEEHFEKGATQWYHLKEHYFNLLCSIFDALAYSTGKKAKNNPLEKIIEQEKKKGGGGRGKRKRVDDNDSSADLSEKNDEVEQNLKNNESNYIQGNEDISLYIETLLKESRVSGYRIWIFDTYVSKDSTNSDLLSLGLKESLLEAKNIQELAKKQLASIQKNPSQRANASAKAKKGPQKVYRVSKEYSFTNYFPHDNHFLGLLKTYFYKDPCSLTTENLEYDDEEEEEEEEEKLKVIKSIKFRDNRPFFNIDTLSNNKYSNVSPIDLSHDYNISSLFSKEVAMVYYVHSEAINEDQCRLENYFSNCSNNLPSIYSSPSSNNNNSNNDSDHCNINIDDIESILSNEKRTSSSHNEEVLLNRLINTHNNKSKSPDSNFNQFPHKNITYLLENTFLSHEFIDRMPLPHRIGTTLYTQEDTKLFKNILKTTYNYVDENEKEGREGGDGDNDEDDNIYMNRNKSSFNDRFGNKLNYYGLHQTEYALTSETLIDNIHHIDIKHRNNLHSSLTLNKDIKNKFIENKLNEINSRLKIIISNLGYKGRVLISENIDEEYDHFIPDKKRSKLELTDGSCTSIMNSNYHYIADEDEFNVNDTTNNISHKPYISRTLPSLINNKNKKNEIIKKAKEYARSIKSLANNAVLLKEKERDEEIERDLKVASGHVGYFKEVLEKYRPFDNSLSSIKKHKTNTRVEHVFLERDIFLRLNEYNQDAYARLDAMYYDHETGQLPVEREEAYFKDKRELQEAMVVECLHELLTNNSVSLACLGIRSDLLKQPLTYLPTIKRKDTSVPIMSNNNNNEEDNNLNSRFKRRKLGTPLPVFEHTQELRPYGAFRAYIHGFISDQGGITYNYKTIALLYFSKFHHCRWHPECNDPKLNIILSGSGMAGKSKALQFTKKTCPTGVGDMVTHITDQAFNVDRNLNDMLLIYEEFQNKYLGYSANSGAKNASTSSGGGGGGVSSGNDKDTTNFFKARLTSGKTMTLSWFENEETGKRDMKISQAHCQGSLMGASNNDFSDADMNVLSRLILISVPKSKNAVAGYRPQDRNKPTYGNDQTQNEKMFEEHREIHRIVYVIEQMIKSGVLGDDKYGANVDGARIMITAILDHLQLKYGIQTNDIRKRDHVLELARCMCLSFAAHFGLTSSITRFLQEHPDPEIDEFLGFNPRVLIDGIFPWLVVTKDHVVDAVTSLSCLWYHEYQDLILEVFATKKCKLHELNEADFLVKNKNDKPYIPLKSTRSSSSNTIFTSGGLSNSGSNSGMGFNNNNSNFGSYGGSSSKQDNDKEIDYNYITISGKHQETLHLLSIALGELIVSPQDIGKLLHDLEKSYIETDGYEMSTEEQEDGKIVKKLVRSKETRKTRKVVEFSYSQMTGKPTISILVQFLKQKLPNLLNDDIIEDLSKDDATWIESEEIRIKKREQERRELNLNNDNYILIDEEEAVDLNEYEEVVDQQEQEEEDNETSKLYKRIRKIGKIGDRTETSIIKSIKDVMQNSVLEYTGLTIDEEKKMNKSYMNPVTKEVPWMSYITADHPKQVTITDFYPELKDKIKSLKEPTDKDILFVDKLLVLDLERKNTGKKFIITNYNTVSPSTKESLSIYQKGCNRLSSPMGTEKALTKKRIDKYTKTDTWELDYDIDFIFCQEHLRNIAFKTLKSKPDYNLINYPPCTYMAVIEDKRNRMKENGIDTEIVGDMLKEYPLNDNMTRIVSRKRKINGEIDPTNTKYKSFSEFMTSDYNKESDMKKIKITIAEPTHRVIKDEKKRKLEYYESMVSNTKKNSNKKHKK